VHRAFFHAFLTHGVLTVEEVKPILAHVMSAHSKRCIHIPSNPYALTSPPDPDRPWTEGDVTLPHITSTIQTINAKIERYDFEIRSTKDQHTKLTHYALVNKTSDSLTQLATKFSAGEIAYIRRLLDCMFETNNTHTREVMAVKHAEATQLARLKKSRQSQVNGDADGEATQSTDPGISIPEAEVVLRKLLDDAFLHLSKAKYYSLAPRALMELRAYLKETYNEDASESENPVIRIHDCEGCQEIVTHGARCNNRDCAVRWHAACANSYYRARKEGNRKCPKCKTECRGDIMVGEGADKSGGRSSTGGGRRSTRAEEVDEEEEEDE
jgi:hypothetical protein